ncbi:hypothetical protein EWB00_005225, partial [Schistosoma japonicum]
NEITAYILGKTRLRLFLQLPDLFFSNIREPYLDFMDTQTYQARVEYITTVEDPSSANKTHGLHLSLKTY